MALEASVYPNRYCRSIFCSFTSTESLGLVCGSTRALMDAGVPIRRPVAGISCGLISDQETGEWRTFTDIQGVEDFHGEMDFKVAPLLWASSMVFSLPLPTLNQNPESSEEGVEQAGAG